MNPLRHVINVINKASHTQHRLMVGKKCILEGLFKTGSKEELMARECIGSYVAAQAEQEKHNQDMTALASST